MRELHRSIFRNETRKTFVYEQDERCRLGSIYRRPIPQLARTSSHALDSSPRRRNAFAIETAAPSSTHLFAVAAVGILARVDPDSFDLGAEKLQDHFGGDRLGEVLGRGKTAAVRVINTKITPSIRSLS
jgi:hypothetical protein